MVPALLYNIYLMYKAVTAIHEACLCMEVPYVYNATESFRLWAICDSTIC